MVDNKPLANRYDPYQIKGKVDEYITDYMEKRGKLTEDHKY
jgi:hypothetical protein